MLISPVSANDRRIPALKIEEESKEIIHSIKIAINNAVVYKIKLIYHLKGVLGLLSQSKNIFQIYFPFLFKNSSFHTKRMN